jgi:hypothetical protein
MLQPLEIIYSRQFPKKLLYQPLKFEDPLLQMGEGPERYSLITVHWENL